VSENAAFSIFLFGFILVFTFGLLNMIVAMVVEKTLDQSKKMDEVDEGENKKRCVEELYRIRQVFAAADVNHSGLVSQEEFIDAIRDRDDVRACMTALQIPTQDAATLFCILDSDDSGSVSLEELLEGCAKLSGASPPEWDALTIQASIRMLATQLEHLQRLLLPDIDCCEIAPVPEDAMPLVSPKSCGLRGAARSWQVLDATPASIAACVSFEALPEIDAAPGQVLSEKNAAKTVPVDWQYSINSQAPKSAEEILNLAQQLGDLDTPSRTLGAYLMRSLEMWANRAEHGESQSLEALEQELCNSASSLV